MTTQELKYIAAKIDRIRHLEKQVRRLNELDCNLWLTELQQKRRDKLEAEFSEIAKEMHLQAEHQRDPSDAALKLHDIGVDVNSSTGTVL